MRSRQPIRSPICHNKSVGSSLSCPSALEASVFDRLTANLASPVWLVSVIFVYKAKTVNLITMAVLSRKGYVIDKSAYSGRVINEIKEDLTVKPRVNPDFVSKELVPYPVYRESNTKLYLPRYYGLEKLGSPEKQSFPDLYDRPRLSTNIKLRDYQIPVVEETLSKLRDKGGGILALATGLGKTSIALYLIAELKKKALVIVHKSFLLEQWRERIQQFLPDARVGIVQASTVDVSNKDIVIGMLQTISMKTHEADIFQDIGTVVVDECHHIGAEVFCRALPKVASQYTLALSATLERKDGLTKVIKWYLGDVAYTLERQDTHNVLLKRIIFKSSEQQYCKECRNWKGTAVMQRMITNIINYAPRNELIVHELGQYVTEDQRQIMVLSERLAHLDELKRLFDEKAITIQRDGSPRLARSGLYTGKLKQKELKENETCDVIFASYSIAREALDIVTLNTLVLATPVTDVVQCCGRIMRKAHRLHPLIIDIVDQFSAFKNQAQKRKRYYTSKHFELTSLQHSDGDGFGDLVMTSENMHTRVFVENVEPSAESINGHAQQTLDSFLTCNSSESSADQSVGQGRRHEPYGFLSSDSDDAT